MSSAVFADGYALDVATQVIALARRRGLAAAAAVNAGEGLSLAVRNDELETLEHHRDKVLSVTVFDGTRKGTATTTDFSAESLAQTVAAAGRIADFAEPDPFAGLVAPEYLATAIPDLALDHPWDIAIDEAARLAREAAAAASAHPDVQQVDEAGLSHYRGLHAYADSQGFAAAYSATRHSISCSVVGARDGAMQSGYWYSLARRATDLEAPDSIGRIAAARAVAKLGARKISTRKAPVLFEARIATGLIGHLIAAISGGTLYREASFLCKAAGTRLFPSFLQIVEDPHLVGALGSAPFDGEGVRTQPRALIDAGVLTGYVLDGYSARRLQLTPTGNAGGVHNLVVSDQGADFKVLVNMLGTGLLVTDLMGFGVNLLTGDYSRGASGFWVEGGEIAYPVEEITIAGNLREMFLGLIATGTDRELRGGARTGSILLAEMTIAGD